MKWLRTRVTSRLVQRSTGKGIYVLLGERDDGGVFYQMFYSDDEADRVNAQLDLDRFLTAPLVPESVGQFDVEPNFYVEGMSPARL